MKKRKKRVVGKKKEKIKNDFSRYHRIRRRNTNKSLKNQKKKKERKKTVPYAGKNSRCWCGSFSVRVQP